MANVALAGYVPLIQGFTTGNTGYLTFGLPGVYGLYNAFASAYGTLSFYLFLKRRKPIYLFAFGTVLLIFLLFVTRQNLISVIVMAFVVYSFVRKRIPVPQLAISIIIFLLLFAWVGQFRSGNINDVARIKQEYLWLPKATIWVYAYGYFNVANLDNLVQDLEHPLFDGSAFFQLLPSVIRPERNHPNYLEVSNFTVSSYLFPIYQDLGIWGVLWLTALFSLATGYSYRRALRKRRFFQISSYSVLYFCALFSFFVNFWFFLPIIAQIPFLRIFSWICFHRRPKLEVPSNVETP